MQVGFLIQDIIVIEKGKDQCKRQNPDPTQKRQSRQHIT